MTIEACAERRRNATRVADEDRRQAGNREAYEGGADVGHGGFGGRDGAREPADRRLQIRVAILCTLIQICDGYDINSIAWAVPSLIHAWHLPPPAVHQAFLWSSIGILVGALSAGPIGDRVGRKPLLIASLTIFGVASLLSAFAASLVSVRLALLHRARDRRRVSRRGVADRRLRARIAGVPLIDHG